MIIFIEYDENEVFGDVIYVPDDSIAEVEQKQEEFYKLLFDTSNNHRYWKTVDGKKKYCEYDSQAFVEWLNKKTYNSLDDKAKVIQKNTKNSFPVQIFYIFNY